MAYEGGPHCSATSVTTTGKSGRPVAAPALSLQFVRSLKFCASSTDVPMRAKLLLQPWMNAFVAFSEPSFVSTPVTLIVRPASPPLAFSYAAHALTPVIDPWNRPAEPGTSMAAGTVMLIVFASTPTSDAVLAPPGLVWALATA